MIHDLITAIMVASAAVLASELLVKIWDFLRPMNLSGGAVARAVGVPRTRIERVADQKMGITADTALRVAKFFGTTPMFWLNLQVQNTTSNAVGTKSALNWARSSRCRKSAIGCHRLAKVIWLQIDRPPDAIIGLSGLPQALNASQFAEFAKDAQLQNSVVSQSLFVDMVKGNSEQVFEGIERALRIAPSEPGASLSRN